MEKKKRGMATGWSEASEGLGKAEDNPLTTMVDQKEDDEEKARMHKERQKRKGSVKRLKKEKQRNRKSGKRRNRIVR